MQTIPSLADQSWLKAEPLQRLLGVLSAGGGQARVAGGAVRNALLAEPVADIDIATSLPPHSVTEVAEKAGMSVHATGVEHGTVTVVIHADGETHAYEVTTLRIDVETDGRRAKVAFTDDWVSDASRRDFTLNALYCDADGTVYDPLNGYGDLMAHRIRFAGDPRERIREDHLRILRFFRFHARFGDGAMDQAALTACIETKESLGSLSGERIRSELFKLLIAPGVMETVRVMDEAGILQSAFPCDADIERLQRMCDIDAANELVPDAELRLAALADPRANSYERLRLSNEQSARLDALRADGPLTPPLRPGERRIILYQKGADRYRDAVRLAWAGSSAAADDAAWASLLQLADEWPVPVFPVQGKDLLARGIAPGPGMGEQLRALEDWWVAAGFPDDKDEILAQLQG